MFGWAETEFKPPKHDTTNQHRSKQPTQTAAPARREQKLQPGTPNKPPTHPPKPPRILQDTRYLTRYIYRIRHNRGEEDERDKETHQNISLLPESATGACHQNLHRDLPPGLATRTCYQSLLPEPATGIRLPATTQQVPAARFSPKRGATTQRNPSHPADGGKPTP